MITVEIFNEQNEVPLDEQRVRRAVEMILEDAAVSHAEISIAVVDDPTIRRLHGKYLDEDEPTDVLSFVLQQSPQRLEGEVIVGAETAEKTAPQFGWPAEDELLLYVIHGTLHLVGYDDTTPEKQAEMRDRERACLARCGLKARYEPSGAASTDPVSGGKQIS